MKKGEEMESKGKSKLSHKSIRKKKTEKRKERMEKEKEE